MTVKRDLYVVGCRGVFVVLRLFLALTRYLDLNIKERKDRQSYRMKPFFSQVK